MVEITVGSPRAVQRLSCCDMSEQEPSLVHRDECGVAWPMLVWRFERPTRAISSGPCGGGIGPCEWVINATVHKEYSRRDLDAHVSELAAAAGLIGQGVGLLTAVDVRDATRGTDDGVTVVATVGLGHPTWAAAPDGDLRNGPGTVNVVALVPAPLSDAALVNAVMTVTEAKAQALWERGVEATGTASDAVFVACLGSGAAERFAGPRSLWGARLARAVRIAVASGTDLWSQRYGQ
jgi:adenosylcobinamide amidohydrolase